MDKICFCGHPHSAHVVGGLECLTPECLCKSFTVASSKLSDVPFVAAQQIYSAFSKFGPPHSESCSEGCTEHNWGKLPHTKWRIGQGGDVSSERAIYKGDKLIGTMDHTWDAMTVVLAVNSWKADQEIRTSFEWSKEQIELAYARGRAESDALLTRMKGHLIRAMCGCTSRDCRRHGAYAQDECDEAMAIKHVADNESLSVKDWTRNE